MREETSRSWEEVLGLMGMTVKDFNEMKGHDGFKTKESITYTIRKRYLRMQGLRKKDLSKVNLGVLHTQGVEFFGSWENAIKESGIPQSEINVLLSHQKCYTRHQLIRYLQSRDIAEKGFRIKDLKDDGDYKMSRYIHKEFGDMKNALKQAGITNDWKERIKKQQLLNKKMMLILKVQERYRKGEGVRLVDMKNEGLEYHVYSLKDVCTWEDILIESGIDELEVKNIMSGFKYGTKESVIAGIQKRVQENKGLRFTDLIEEKERGLYKQGVKFFGYWHKALETAGVPVWYEKKRSKMTKVKK